MKLTPTSEDRTLDLGGMPYHDRFTAEYGEWKAGNIIISGWYVWDHADQHQEFGQLFQDRADAEEWVEVAHHSQRAQDHTFLVQL